MNVTACLVTRGDVDMQPIIDSLPAEWEKIVWDNKAGRYSIDANGQPVWHLVYPTDLSVYGRYAAIEYATHDLIYVQDDDVIVSDPQAIVDRFNAEFCGDPKFEWDGVVCNMPPEFRHDGYTDSALVGFGAAFHRDAPARAFRRFLEAEWHGDHEDEFHRCCDVVFTTLTPRVLVDVPKTNLPYATDDSRMYRQPDHVGERARMLELARAVRDARVAS